MAALPALTKTYAVTANIPYGSNNTSTTLLTQYTLWLISRALMNTGIPGGTSSGVRNANSVWSCVGSCNGTTFNTSGTDLWTNTFSAANFVQGNNTSTATSWTWLRNTNYGFDLVLTYNSVSALNAGVFFGLTGSFSGGSVNASPLPSATGGFVNANSFTATATRLLFADTTLNGSNYMSIVTTDDGRFYIFFHRAGSGLFSGVLSFFTTINPSGTDSRGGFCWYSTSAVGRGAHTSAQYDTSYAVSGLSPLSSSISANGGVRSINGGNIGASTYTAVDQLANNVPYFPVEIITNGTYRGQLVDVYLGYPVPVVGSSYPTAAAQERVLVGDVLFPWPVVNPIM